MWSLPVSNKAWVAPHCFWKWSIVEQCYCPATNSSQSDNLQVKSHFLVKQTDWCYILGSSNLPIRNQMRHILIILSFLLLSSPLFGQSSKPLGVVLPPTVMGNVSNSRKQILLNTLDKEMFETRHNFNLLLTLRLEKINMILWIISINKGCLPHLLLNQTHTGWAACL